MFGFGMSEKDKWILGQVEILLAPIANQMEQDVKPLAKQIFDTTKAELAANKGQDIYSETLGDKLIATQNEYIEKRLAAGLTIEDIKHHWNQPYLMGFLQNRILEMSEFMALNMAIIRETGKTMDKLTKDEISPIAIKHSRNMRLTNPRWGDPEQWNRALPVNEGFTQEDADIYIEFTMRVGRWWEMFSDAEKAAYTSLAPSKYSSFNALVRDKIRKKII